MRVENCATWDLDIGTWGGRGEGDELFGLRVKPDLISRIKEAQKEDNEIWTIVENLDKQVEFRLDDDN
nr:zinc finger, CCHC-type, retrotransposon Gag domain protein [Tanacetum cinerariifolium]